MPAWMTTIEGFHQDPDGDWVADLACGHSQHMRHRPPWQNRPWVLNPAERQAKVGTDIECPLCEMHGDIGGTIRKLAK